MNIHKTLICKIRGHDWEKQPVVRDVGFPEKVVGICRRCGYEATGAEAMAFGDRVPHELIEQDGVEEIQARYVQGEIDEKELEYFLDKAASRE